VWPGSEGQVGCGEGLCRWDGLAQGAAPVGAARPRQGCGQAAACIPTLPRVPSCRRLPVSTKPIEDDVDVANERHRVLRGDADNDMLKIENLTKVPQRGGGGRGCSGAARRHLGAVPSEGWGSGLGGHPAG